VTSVSGAPYAFHAKLAEVASLFSSKELAVVANVGSLVQPLTRAQYQSQQAPIPLNLFSHSDQQLQWQTAVAQGHNPTGWAGRAADYIAGSGINTGNFPVFVSVAGNALEGTGVQTQPAAITPGQALGLAGFKGTAVSNARLSALKSLLTTNTGVSLVQAANNTMANGISDAKTLEAALTKATALKTQFPATDLGAQLQQVAQIIQVQGSLGMQRQIFFCSLGGFDTHANELATHNTLYPQLSPALAAFYDATQELGVAQNVTTFTESDFSRTFQPTRTTAAIMRGAAIIWCWEERCRAGRFSVSSRRLSWRVRTMRMCVGGGFRPRRSISMARRCVRGLGFQTRRSRRCFRTSRILVR
jgi:uncharacterized protein (DUF1501 family)